MIRPDMDAITLRQLTNGYISSAGAYKCLFCNKSYEKGMIYPQGPDLVDAELAMKNHIKSAHTSVFHALMGLGKKGTGLSEKQRNLLSYLFKGLSDKDIRPLFGDVSLSTIRNHRFVLREKARQAKVFLALMQLIEQNNQDPRSRFIDIPGRLPAYDERFAITHAEYIKIVNSHFPDGPDGMMIRFPKKEKRKVAVMIQILKRFDPSRHYTQAEVNEILATAYEDYTTLCRYMVDYGFLGRTRDGSEYWVQ